MVTLALAVGAAVLAVALVAAGVAWRGSSLLLVPRPYALRPEFRILAVDEGTVTLPAPAARDRSPFADTRRRGVYGLLWEGGHGRLGAVTADDGAEVVRPLTRVSGAAPRPGEPARMDNFVYRRDPLRDLGLPFEEVAVESAVGALPAWWLPAEGRTAVLVVHGRRRGERAETLRALPPVVEGGRSALVIAYRNHRGAPASPDGFYHYGATEAEDVLAGVRYLAERGFGRVALFGFSMGGAAVLEAVKRWPAGAPELAGLLFDSPLIDPAAATVARLQEAGMPLPRVLARASLGLAAWRSGVRFARLDQRRSAPAITVPVLLIAGVRDRTVPIASVDAFAERVAGPITYRRVPDADHVEAWNRDPDAYRAWVEAFLASLDAAGGS